MKTHFLKRQTKSYKDFVEREWKEADLEHYGKILDWKCDKHILLMKDGKKILGVAEFEIELDICTVKDFVVSKAYRRKGIGRTLFQKMEEFAQIKKVHKIHLITGKNWASELFYKSIGYQKSGTLPKHFLKHDFIAYHKFI